MQEICIQLAAQDNSTEGNRHKLLLKDALQKRITDPAFLDKTPPEELKRLFGKATSALESVAEKTPAHSALDKTKSDLFSAAGSIALNPDILKKFPEEEQSNRIKTAACFVLLKLEKGEINDVSEDMLHPELLKMLSKEDRADHIKNYFSACAKLAFTQSDKSHVKPLALSLRSGAGALMSHKSVQFFSRSDAPEFGTARSSLSNSLKQNHIHDVLTQAYLKENGLLNIQDATGDALEFQCELTGAYAGGATESFRATYHDIAQKRIGNIEAALNEDILIEFETMQKDLDVLNTLARTIESQAYSFC